MLSISNPMKSAGGAVAYYLDEAKEDYYLNGIDKQGRWFGGAARAFGLSGTVDRESFHNLLDGFAPDRSKPLVQNAGEEGRTACWDMTFNAPKAVSVLWAMSEADLRRRIEAIHRQAVETALDKAEQVGGITRRGPGGRIHDRASLLWATFQEGTSRAQDPHLHTHAVLPNLALRTDGTTGSLHTTNLFRWKMALGAVFQAELAFQLHAQLGLEIEPATSGFGIRGVPATLCHEFSKRRQAIDQNLEERGVSGAVEAKTAAKNTRPRKLEVPPALLLPQWHAIGEAFGWGPKQARSLIRHGHRKTVTAEQLESRVHEAIAAVPANGQHRSPLVREAARLALAHGADGSTLFESLTRLEFEDGRRVLWQPRERGAHQVESEARAGPRQGQAAYESPDHQTNLGMPATPTAPGEKAHREQGRDRTGPTNTPRQIGREDHLGEGHQAGPSTGPAGQDTERRGQQRERDAGTAGSSAGKRQDRSNQHGHSDSRQGQAGREQSRAHGAGSWRRPAGSETQGRSEKTRTHFIWTMDQLAGLDPRKARSPMERRALIRKWLNVAYSGAIKVPMPEKRTLTSPTQARANRRFARFLSRRMVMLPARRQTLKRMTRLAVRMACRRGVDPQTLHAALQKVSYEVERLRTHLPRRKPIVRIERKGLFRHRPPQKPCPIQLPVVRIGARDPKWWRIKWRLKLLRNVELRLQQRVLFPKVARWNPLQGATVPALRLVVRKPKARRAQRPKAPSRTANTSPDSREQNSSKSDRQSHTYSH
ncbi:MAG: MobF family relaxase [Limisphaerales bacterium]